MRSQAAAVGICSAAQLSGPPGNGRAPQQIRCAAFLLCLTHPWLTLPPQPPVSPPPNRARDRDMEAMNTQAAAAEAAHLRCRELESAVTSLSSKLLVAEEEVATLQRLHKAAAGEVEEARREADKARRELGTASDYLAGVMTELAVRCPGCRRGWDAAAPISFPPCRPAAAALLPPPCRRPRTSCRRCAKTTKA